MPELEAAIGIVQMRKLPTFIAKRRQNAEQLTKSSKPPNKIDLPFETETQHHSWYLYTARLKQSTEIQRNKLIEDLKAKGICAEHTMLIQYIPCPSTTKTMEQHHHYLKLKKPQNKSFHFQSPRSQ